MSKNALVVNFFGPPSVGKSATCYDVCAKLKWRQINCDIAHEYAKDKVWEGSEKVLNDQLYVFAKQRHKIVDLRHQTDVILTDSPLMISLFYDKSKSKPLHDLIRSEHNKCRNLNFYLERDASFKYEESGRYQSEEEMKDIDVKFQSFIKWNVSNVITVKGDFKSVEHKMNWIVNKIITRINSIPTEVTRNLLTSGEIKYVRIKEHVRSDLKDSVFIIHNYDEHSRGVKLRLSTITLKRKYPLNVLIPATLEEYTNQENYLETAEYLRNNIKVDNGKIKL